MTWLWIALVALVALALAIVVLKAPRVGWEAIAAALFLGLAGYALQGSPGQPSAPRAATESHAIDGAGIVAMRIAFSDSGIPPTNRWVVIADGLTRNGQFADAAGILRNELEDEPGNAEAWTALGNVLVAHAEGQPTPAALEAFRRAIAADPRAPGPRFFLGLAQAEEGQLPQARQAWLDALALGPADASWRPVLERQVAAMTRAISGHSPETNAP